MSGDRYGALARHGDPVLREIGQQLSLGQVRPASLLAVPEYQRVIERGLTRLTEAAEQATRAAPAGLEPPRRGSAPAAVRTAP